MRKSNTSTLKRALVTILGIETAKTPPSHWYTSTKFLDREKDLIFKQQWQPLGVTSTVTKQGDFISGNYMNEPYVKDSDTFKAYSNVCLHHAAPVAPQPTGNVGANSCFTCPYHGWTYRIADGRLSKATRIKGMGDFQASQIKLQSIPLYTWGPLFFLNFAQQQQMSTGELDRMLHKVKHYFPHFETGYEFYERVTFDVPCNWKVIVENYLDGGYHVPYLHTGLGSQLDMAQYKTELFETHSIQSCKGSTTDANSNEDYKDRVGDYALYMYKYPNWMINIYQSMFDINVVVPISEKHSQIIYYYYFNQNVPVEQRKMYLEASKKVQHEDTYICDLVQKGLMSSTYAKHQGRYAPQVEMAMYHFHQLLQQDMNKS